MMERWHERRVEDDLLKRELLLRLRAEHYGTAGRSRPATDQFRRQVRLMLLRHPLFAFKYYLLAIDLGLGRVEGRGRDDLGDHEHHAGAALGPPPRDLYASRTRGGALAGARPLSSVNARAPRIAFDAGGVRRKSLAAMTCLVVAAGWLRRLLFAAAARAAEGCEKGVAALLTELRRQRVLAGRILLRVQRACGVASTRLVAKLRRERLILRMRVARLRRTSGAWRARIAWEARHQKLVLDARLVRIRPACASEFARVVAQGRRVRLVLRIRLLRFERVCGLAVGRVAVEARRQGWLISGRFVRLGRACRLGARRLAVEVRRQRPHLYGRFVGPGRTVAGRMVELRPQRRVLQEPFGRLWRTCRSTLAAAVAIGRRQGSVLLATLVRLRLTCRSALTAVVLELGRLQLLARARVVGVRRICVSAIAGLLVEFRRRWVIARARAVGIRRICATALTGSVVDFRRRRLLLYARVVGVCRSVGTAAGGLVAEWQRKRQDLSAGTVRLASRAHAAVRLAASAPANELSLRRIERSRRASAASWAPRRHPQGRVIAATVVAVPLAGLAVTAAVLTGNFGSGGGTGSTASTKPPSVLRLPDFGHPPRTVSKLDVAAQSRRRSAKPVERPATKVQRRVQAKPARQTILVSNTVQTASVPAKPGTSRASAATAPPSHGPAPLRAPAGAPSPTPLKAPHP